VDDVVTYEFCTQCPTFAELTSEGGLCVDCYDNAIDTGTTGENRHLQYYKDYNRRPDVAEHRRQYYQRPEVIALRRVYRERPDVKVRIAAYHKRLDVVERQKESRKKYRDAKRASAELTAIW
jgi:hypothetical protein